MARISMADVKKKKKKKRLKSFQVMSNIKVFAMKVDGRLDGLHLKTCVINLGTLYQPHLEVCSIIM